MAKDKGIQIIELNATEIDQRFEQVCNLLLSKLVSSKSIYARKCQIVDLIGTKTVTDFINRNHIQPIQGLRKNEWCYGLRYKDELVAVRLFSPHHRQGHNEVVLKRFCCEKGMRVIGGASRLLKHAMKENHWNRVISWSDNRFSTGNLYEKLVSLLRKNYHRITHIGTPTTETFAVSKAVRRRISTANQIKQKKNGLKNWDCTGFGIVERNDGEFIQTDRKEIPDL